MVDTKYLGKHVIFSRQKNLDLCAHANHPGVVKALLQTTDFGALSQLKSPCFSGPMNPLPAALPRSQSSAGSVGNAAAISTTASPTSVKGKRSRKRESSSASELDGYEGSVGDKKRQPGVKRACNECRQQKVGWA